MNKALFAALASVALVGASCSVQDFAPVVLEKPTITASFPDAPQAVLNPPSESTTPQVGDVFSALWVGNPQSENYINEFYDIFKFRVANGNTSFFVMSVPNGQPAYNRLIFSDSCLSYIANLDTFSLVGGQLMVGGDSQFDSMQTNRDVTIYFKVPMVVTGVFNNASFAQDFALPPEQSGYSVGYSKGYYDAERDNGIFNHAYYVTGNDGTNTVTNFIDDSLLEWYSSANTQGLFDPYSLVSFLGLSNSANSYTITIQYGEYYSVQSFPLAAFPLYVDVMSDGVVEDDSLCPSLTISTYRGGSIRGYTLFDAVFNTSYAGLATGYPDYAVYNREYDSFNRISLYLPKNQSYSDMRQLGVVSPYAQGYMDGVTSRDGEVGDLTERIRNLEVDLSQYQGKTYEQIYNLGVQAGLDENAQGAATFNSLFGNILTAPLTILNGVSDISFFGMPILTAILSLLMVAFALFLFKRFK